MLKKTMSTIFIFLLMLITFNSNVIMLNSTNCSLNIQTPIYKKIIEYFLPKSENTEITHSTDFEKWVYVSGYPVGFSLNGDGAIVVEKGSVVTKDGYKTIDNLDKIKVGDIVKSINGEPVTSGESICEIVNRKENLDKILTLQILRDSKIIEVELKAEYDIYATSYRLGLWVRDNAVGVGMMTYVDENGNFGALGHAITDIDTGKVIPVLNGNAFKCTIIGVNRGSKGNPGELKGLFLKSSNSVGIVNKNNNNGVFGKLNESSINLFQYKLVQLANPNEVQIGEATIISTIDGSTPKEYRIEIVKSNHTSMSGQKCMVIKIVDKELLALTGGIVQGMSGSPILQNGKLIGCVTHVFVNDPERGFASFITNMDS